jgi:hypothetical protein
MSQLTRQSNALKDSALGSERYGERQSEVVRVEKSQAPDDRSEAKDHFGRPAADANMDVIADVVRRQIQLCSAATWSINLLR